MDVKIKIGTEEDYKKAQELFFELGHIWIDGNEPELKEYEGEKFIFSEDEKLTRCVGICDGCGACDEVDTITMEELVKMSRGNPETTFKVGDRVYVVGTITEEKDADGELRIEFKHKDDFDYFPIKDVVSCAVNTETEILKREKLELERKVKELENKLDKYRGVIAKRNKLIDSLNQVVYAKKTLDASQDIKQVLKGHNTEFKACQGRFNKKNVQTVMGSVKASIMLKDRDLSEEIEHDEMILKNRT